MGNLNWQVEEEVRLIFVEMARGYIDNGSNNNTYPKAGSNLTLYDSGMLEENDVLNNGGL